MRKSNLRVNAILNVIKTSLSILFPLITYPYALRTIGTSGLGKVSYTASIVSYFSLFAMLGVATYGVREGAKKRENKEELNAFVSEVFSINVITTLIAYVALMVMLLFVQQLKDYRWLILIQSISIAFTTVGMDWINTIFEDFKRLTIRSIITHIVSLCLLFLIVHTPDDYYRYASLSVVTNCIICISNLIYIHKKVDVRITFSASLKKHINPLLIMFANNVAILVYVNFDTTMLGWIKGDFDVGLYAVPVKIYSVLKTMLAAVYAVAIPRLAQYANEKKYDDYKKTYSSLCGYLTTLLVPTCVGFGCVSYEILYIMGRSEATGGTLAMQILAGSLFFAIYGGLVTAVMNITIGREKSNLIATILSASLNFGLNFVFIPLFSLHGAAFTTLLSELFVLVFCIFKNRDVFYLVEYSKIAKPLFQSIIGSLLIIAITVIGKSVITNVFIRLICIVAASAFLYAIVMLVTRNECAIWAITKAKNKMMAKRAIRK